MIKKSFDKVILVNFLLIILYGLVIFFSASLGLLARGSARFGSIVSNQIFFGIILGGILAILIYKIDYKILGRFSFWLWIIAVASTFMVFIPWLGFSHGGARRWIYIAGMTLQPAEFLKIAYIIYLSAWLARIKGEVKTFKYGLLPFMAISGITISGLILQPDMGTSLLILTAGTILYFISGANLKHIALVILTAILLFTGLVFAKPYLLKRITTFFDYSLDSQGSSYQIQQSIISIGSGQLTGRGFGQSLQKFYYLPEPIGDSIFAVASEEFGFVGMIILIILFVTLAIRGVLLSIKAKDKFSGLLLLGLVILVVSQSFFNMGAMLGILPLSGLPLIFVSHGGTAMLFSIISIGIILNISRNIK